MHYTNNKVQVRVLESKTRHHNNQVPVSLRPSHLLGVYVVWMIGLLISMVAFVFELMWYRRKTHEYILKLQRNIRKEAKLKL